MLSQSIKTGMRVLQSSLCRRREKKKQKNDASLSAEDLAWLVPFSSPFLSSILRKMLISGRNVRCHWLTQAEDLLGAAFSRLIPRITEDCRLCLLGGIKTLWAPVQSSGERKFSLGVLSGEGVARHLSMGLARQSLWGSAVLKWSQLTINSWL